MKKLLTLAACVAAATAFAQGNISISETAWKVSINNGTSTSVMSTTANQDYFTVLEWNGAGTPTVTSASDLLSSSWYSTLCMGTNATSVPKAGQIAGVASYTISGTGTPWDVSATTAYYIEVGWTATEGTTWATIANSILTGNWAVNGATGAMGWSIIGQAPSSAGVGTVLGGVAPTINVGYTLFNSNVQPIPEPATIALGGLGGLSLLLFRRRK